MPEIEITDDQREYLEDLRAELEEDVVYGHVRLTDALQFLIDSREGELSAAQKAAGSEPGDDEEDDGTDFAPSDEEDAEAESNDEDGQDDAAGDAEGEEVGDTDNEAIDDAEVADTDDADEEDADEEDATDDNEKDAEDADTDDADEEDADEDESEEDAEPAAAPTPGGGDRLNAMMQLLDTHDEKWREAPGDARYEVDLPDGSTETANTKDDVRALLFKNY